MQANFIDRTRQRKIFQDLATICKHSEIVIVTTLEQAHMKTMPPLMSINVSAQKNVNRNLLATLENLSFSNHLTLLGTESEREQGRKGREIGQIYTWSSYARMEIYIGKTSHLGMIKYLPEK